MTLVAPSNPGLDSADDIALADRLKAGHDQILAELHKLIVGQEGVIDLVLTSILSGGNSLIIGVPGLAKTLLIHTIAQVIDLKFNRIQFTPDLMPSDITGTEIIQDDGAGRRSMVFTKGPIFANIVLADEINRTPPKTQAALLEAMQEHRVTVQGKTYTLDEPFFVFATQNPIELEGTYPLPEAQLDRFMFEIVIDHLNEEHEIQVVQQTTSLRNYKFNKPVSGADIVAFQQLVRRVPCADPVARYAVALARASRPGPNAPDLGQEVGVVRRQRARAAASHPRRQGARADARALPRQLRRHSRAGEAGAASSRAAKLPRRVGAGDDGSTRRQVAGDRPRAEVRDVMATQIDNTAAVPGAHLIDPTVLARIGNLELLARTVVDGFINGLHRAPHLGSSTDFAEHRQYMPGDDIRRIDWRLYARTDKYFVKQYEADTNTNFSVVLDVSKSMRYGASQDTGRVSKLEYGAYLAACLTYFSSIQRDRVGLVTVETDVVDYIPSSAKHLRIVLQTLDRALNAGREASATDAKKGLATAPTLAPPLRKLSEIYRRRSMLVVISDFYEEPEAVVDARQQPPRARQRHHGVPPARSDGAGVSVRRLEQLHRPRDRRENAGDPGVSAQAVSRSGAGTCRVTGQVAS